MDAVLETLIKKAWNQWDKYGDPRSSDFIKEVCPVPPVLFVGDLCAYKKSKIKVITVALNPSKKGSDSNIQSNEFPDWDVAKDMQSLKNQTEKYKKGLTCYFRNQPYRRFYGPFESILNGLDTSFYAVNQQCNQMFNNRALHTDLCSPLTTRPDWGNLDPNVQQKLGEDGSILWNELVRYLKPDVILGSFAEKNLNWVKLQPSNTNSCVVDISTWEIIYKVPKANPYFVRSLSFEIGSEEPQNSLFIFGPFKGVRFPIDKKYKAELGKTLLQYLKDHGLNSVGLAPS
jgi:hypothetical protein